MTTRKTQTRLVWDTAAWMSSSERVRDRQHSVGNGKQAVFLKYGIVSTLSVTERQAVWQFLLTMVISDHFTTHPWPVQFFVVCSLCPVFFLVFRLVLCFARPIAVRLAALGGS